LEIDESRAVKETNGLVVSPGEEYREVAVIDGGWLRTKVKAASYIVRRCSGGSGRWEMNRTEIKKTGRLEVEMYIDAMHYSDHWLYPRRR